jgi:hypothetical protein
MRSISGFPDGHIKIGSFIFEIHRFVRRHFNYLKGELKKKR